MSTVTAARLSRKKRRLFTEFVGAVQMQHVRDTAPATTDEEARDEIEEQLYWIATNLDEEDPDEVLLENLANTVAAALRMAERVMQRMSEEQLAALAAEVSE